MRIDRMGEARLIRLIQRTVKSRGRLRVGIGDDGCVLKNGTVVTTDAYAEGVHFELAYMSYEQVGARCACAALSDVVAMGAEPEVLVVALGLRKGMTDSEVRALYRGIERVCAQLNCEVGGGDIILLDRLVLALTATGRTKRPKLRSEANPDERLFVTGYLGLAETGRLALKLRLPKRGLLPAIRRHIEPLPRIQVLRRLGASVRALIDTSDGLATDARHIGELSRVRVVLWLDKLPIHPATHRLCRAMGLDPVRFALCSGEDYELLFTARRLVVSSVDRVPITCIGSIEAGSGLYSVSKDRLMPVLEIGYDHLTAGQTIT
ncbi:MAG: thiamine-phosphate kinase [candidate division WOR-3 bacterium]